MPNFAFTRGLELPTVQNGHTFELCNFTQRQPHTKIFEGITGLTFKKCNLTNCDLPPDAIVIDSPNRHRSFCTNLRPELINKGILACIKNCSHVINVDISTYTYEDTTEAI